MNRIVLCGVALFFAVVGIALIGGEEKASAGLFGGSGCDGSDCSGASDCCGGKKLFGHHKRCCGGREKCHGSLFSGKCHGREKCHGGLFSKHRCSGKCSGAVDCCGGEKGVELKDAPAPAPADAPPAPPAPEKAA